MFDSHNSSGKKSFNILIWFLIFWIFYSELFNSIHVVNNLSDIGIFPWIFTKCWQQLILVQYVNIIGEDNSYLRYDMNTDIKPILARPYFPNGRFVFDVRELIKDTNISVG